MYNLTYKVILSETQIIEMHKLTPELTPDVFYLLLFLEIHKRCLNATP